MTKHLIAVLLIVAYLAGWILTSARIWNYSNCKNLGDLVTCNRIHIARSECELQSFVGGFLWPVYWSWNGAKVVTKG